MDSFKINYHTIIRRLKLSAPSNRESSPVKTVERLSAQVSMRSYPKDRCFSKPLIKNKYGLFYMIVPDRGNKKPASG
jgi:hypothetical protein